ncbi:hypothetical protein LX66_3284 [Chitinophaga japonensis]|uniref:Uncharacterized protein n=2 Tax=Chitinophaga japonensis TaxID=104662 RepID=A0A562T8N4_CHIJA|nr:hypothetical protein LX66_3284 [Chitinophaga japonensis]
MYLRMKPKQLTALLLLLLPGIAAIAQDTDAVQVYVIDSVEATPYEINGLGPDQIAMITIARGRKTIEKYGERAANGVFYIETKAFARQRYNRMFSNLSPAYAAALQKYGSDSSFRYIVGGSPVTSNQESQLAALEKKDITGIRILDAVALKKEYEVEGKQVGVVIDMK